MDIIERKNIAQERKLIENVIQEIDECVLLYDGDGKLIYANKQAIQVTGYTQQEMMANTQLADMNLLYTRSVVKSIGEMVARGKKYNSVCHLRRKDNTAVSLEMTFIGVPNKEDKINHYITITKDITKKQTTYERIHRIKYIDEVTGLPNQTALEEVLAEMIHDDKEPFTFVLLDISKMSYINNTYGLTTGDLILKELGERMKALVGDTDLIAKMGRAVFSIIYKEVINREVISQRLEDVIKALEAPFYVGNQTIYVQVNCGIVTFPEDGTTSGQLINRAQITLEQAKDLKLTNHCMFYAPQMQEEVQRQTLLESDMYVAYNNNEFVVYYQPSIDLKTKRIIGMEALLRRKRANGEIVPPGIFIELLEQMELIEQVGLRVVEQVCQQLKVWRDKGIELVPIAINLSSTQFKNSHLAKDIMRIMDTYGISPELITLEVTETVVMTNKEQANEIIKELREYGFEIAIDDFGTGYSSLGYLKQFLFNHLKIDISFIREVVQNPQDRAIVAGIISIAKALNLKTVAEGIETPEQLELMYEMGCEIGQGYYWDAPIEAGMLEAKYLKVI